MSRICEEIKKEKEATEKALAKIEKLINDLLERAAKGKSQ